MSGSRLRPYLGPVIALLVVLALGASTVYAAIPNGSGTIYACYVKNTGAVKLINYPKVKTCKAGEKLIKWSAKGPQGPVGPVGPAGPAGPADWNAIGNKPAGFADGVDDVGPASYVTETVACSNPIDAAGEYISFSNLSRNMVHEFMVVPTNGYYLFIEQVEFVQIGSGALAADVLVDDWGNSGLGTCNIRHIAFTQGISPAKAKQQLKKVEVTYHKKHSKE